VKPRVSEPPVATVAAPVLALVEQAWVTSVAAVARVPSQRTTEPMLRLDWCVPQVVVVVAVVADRLDLKQPVIFPLQQRFNPDQAVAVVVVMKALAVAVVVVHCALQPHEPSMLQPRQDFWPMVVQVLLRHVQAARAVVVQAALCFSTLPLCARLLDLASVRQAARAVSVALAEAERAATVASGAFASPSTPQPVHSSERIPPPSKAHARSPPAQEHKVVPTSVTSLNSRIFSGWL
jgi:hypothetical protein